MLQNSPGRPELRQLADPRDLEYILCTNFANYGKGLYNRDYMGDFLGDGIFAVDGEKWRHQRKLASHEFSTRNLRESSSVVFKLTAGKLAQAISETSQPLNMPELLTRATMDSLFIIAFGVELNTMGGADEGSARFVKAFDDSGELIFWRYFDLTWKMKRFFNIGCEAALRRSLRVVDDFVYKIIDQKVEQMARDKAGSVTRKYDILSRFLEEREKEPENISATYLRDIVLNFVIAGKDTTANVLSWFFFMMCKHPDVQKKVAAEVDEATEGSSIRLSMVEFSEKLADVSSLPYLHAALNETLRLHPGVPLDPKTCFSDDTLPSGFDVRGGDVVLYLPYSMGRLEDLWGEDAKDFCPERWFDEDGSLRHESPFKFSAFQAGPRVCLGREFAYSQMKIFVAVLLHFFVFELADDGKDVRYKMNMSLSIHGLQVNAIPREIKR